jgi:hypothetical protein
MGHARATVENDYGRLFAIQRTHDLVPRLVDVTSDFEIYFVSMRIRSHDAVVRVSMYAGKGTWEEQMLLTSDLNLSDKHA